MQKKSCIIPAYTELVPWILVLSITNEMEM